MGSQITLALRHAETKLSDIIILSKIKSYHMRFQRCQPLGAVFCNIRRLIPVIMRMPLGLVFPAGFYKDNLRGFRVSQSLFEHIRRNRLVCLHIAHIQNRRFSEQIFQRKIIQRLCVRKLMNGRIDMGIPVRLQCKPGHIGCIAFLEGFHVFDLDGTSPVRDDGQSQINIFFHGQPPVHPS